MRLRFRATHMPSGNGVVERCHRTIKTIAARTRCSVEEAVYLYNVTPRDDCTADTAPANVLYRYRVRVRAVDDVVEKGEEASRYRRGDCVWMRPPDNRCDQQYARGVVTRVVSEHTVEVDGIPRHVRDLRRRDDDDDDEEEVGASEGAARARWDDDDWSDLGGVAPVAEADVAVEEVEDEPVIDDNEDETASDDNEQAHTVELPRRSARIAMQRMVSESHGGV